MIAPEEKKRRVIEHLRSGQASDEVWNEVAESLLAESELCGAMQLDIELGFARRCGCGDRLDRRGWWGAPNQSLVSANVE